MELLVSAKLAHSKFHGIPWSCSCQRNWRNTKSMEFPVSEIGALQVPRNSMEFHGTSHVSEIGALQVPWNSMELLLSAKLAHPKFHGIPWNCSCQRNWRILSSMEFHGIPWNCSLQRNWRILSSTEFHGTACVSEIGALIVHWNSLELLVSLKLAYSKFHGIPWNSSCQRNWRTQSSMEFLGTAHVSEIGALQVPWNSTKLLVSAKLAHSKFHGIPWNWWCQFHGIPWNLFCYLLEPLVSSMHWVLKWYKIPWNSKFWWKWFSIVPDELISIS